MLSVKSQTDFVRCRWQGATRAWAIVGLMLAIGGCVSRGTAVRTASGDSQVAIQSTAATMPATPHLQANTISEPSYGLIETLPTAVVAQSPVPTLVAPAMADAALPLPPNSPVQWIYQAVPGSQWPVTPASQISAAPVVGLGTEAPASGFGTEAPASSAPMQAENIPAPGNDLRQDRWLPLPPAYAAQGNISASVQQDLISLTARDAPLSSVLSMIAEQHGLNIVTGASVNELISVKITDAVLEDALDVILSTNGYAWTRNRNIIIVSKISADQKGSSPAMQGRQLAIFTMNYISSADADKVVQGLLSPVGQSFINETEPTDHRRTHEQLIVEDLPEYLQRVEQYLIQADTPPRQVQIEAHILQVTLKDNCRHGVNFQEVLKVANSNVTVSTVGLANGTAPGSMLRLEGTELNGLIEALKATTDAKTLASPKITVLNNQEARMQVGGKIGYLMSTTTQTSTLQSVNFLEVGIILNVLPTITLDGQILVKVGPQVSTGRINAATQLPETETTEVETQVMLADGEAIVIGGLIKETDTDSRNKIPILGDLWLVGWLFQRRETVRERNEIIITLVPRIVPDPRDYRCFSDDDDIEQAGTPLLYGSLQQVDRTRFEPKLPCYTIRPRDRQKYPAPPAGQSRNLPGGTIVTDGSMTVGYNAANQRAINEPVTPVPPKVNFAVPIVAQRPRVLELNSPPQIGGRFISEPPPGNPQQYGTQQPNRNATQDLTQPR